MSDAARDRLRRLGAGLVACAYLAGCATPCGLPADPATLGHAAAHAHHAESADAGPLLRAPCYCGCERRPDAAGLSTGHALLPSAPTAPGAWLETFLPTSHPECTGERVAEIDHVPISLRA